MGNMDKNKAYILVDKNGEIYFSKLMKPIADHIGVSTRTIKRWLDKPYLAKKRGYIFGEGNKLVAKTMKRK